MNVRYPSFTAAALRVVIAWLLVMQPMIGAYSLAQAANAPLAMELCRGTPAPEDGGTPAKAKDHSECCLACTPASAPPPSGHAAVKSPLLFAAIAETPAEIIAVRQAGFFPQSARAPPL
jgi:hypothetical protein